jgi:Cdc6-like AAA superfamily ATPase
MAIEKFTWVKTHKQLVEMILNKRNHQGYLIDLLRNAGIVGLHDEAKAGKRIDLQELDPFSFFCFIYKYGTEKRIQILQTIATELGISIPSDDYGVPSVNAQKVCLFPFKHERKNDEINRLWDFFESALNNTITDEQFADVLQILGTGKTKLTEGLYNILPDKYFPINGPAKPYIKEILGIEPVFNTYTEYLSLLEKIKSKNTIPFYELSYEAWKWKDEESNINYWVFQGNPKVFDFETALKQEIINEWTVSAHKDKIKKGDKIIFWIAGKNAGCYALGEVTTAPYEYKTKSTNSLWKTADKSDMKTGIKITHNWVNQPVLFTQITTNESLQSLHVGNQGTNFTATKEQYDTIMKISQLSNKKQYWLYAPGPQASKWDEYYNDGIMALGWGKLGDLSKYKSRVALKVALDKQYPKDIASSRMNDVTANDDFLNKMKVGDIVIAKKGRKEYLGYGIVSSEYYYDELRSEYNSLRKVNWIKKGNWTENEHDIVLKTLTDITRYTDYVSRLIELIGITDVNQNSDTADFPLSLNTIIFGPPGTGKTFSLKNHYMKYFTASENAVTKEEYLSDIIQHCSWWQVIALALRQLGKSKVAEISNHEYIIIKSRFSSSKTVTQTIWGQLLSHTIEESETVKVAKRQPPLIFNKLNNSIWEILDDQIEDQAPELIELEKKINNFSTVSNKEIKRYEFVTFHQSYSYEDFIEGIKPELNETDVAYKIEEGVFLKLCNRARNDRNNKYAIFIDEINRGNISSIFGELITLIEDDKREGASSEIKATLPYSQKSFSVPSNLYIIGTMNTADRSVEALDTALRRRFSFIELNPDPQQLSHPIYACSGIDLSKLLTDINARIEKLLDKDYCIGHSYFMSIKDKNNPLSEIRKIFQNRILPLLQEYFYGDWGKIMLVLGDGFVTRTKSDVIFLSKEKYDNYEEFDEKPIYKFTESSAWSLDTFRSIYE